MRPPSTQVCIDYLLVQSCLEVRERLPMPVLSSTNPIPSEDHPSDHLPIMFRLGFKGYDSQLYELARAWVLVVLAEDDADTAANAAHAAPLTHDQLQRAFGFFDLSTNGGVEPKELVDGMRELGGFERQAGLVTSVLGGRLSRKLTEQQPLSQDDFRRLYTDAFKRHKMQFREEMVAAFSYFDTDSSGTLEYQELFHSFQAACPFLVTEKLFGELWTKIDANGDGAVSVDEFVDYLISHAAGESSSCRLHADPARG